jgi:hypothetical protein
MCRIVALVLTVLLAVMSLPTSGPATHHSHGTISAGFAKADLGGPGRWTAYSNPETGTTVEYPSPKILVRGRSWDANVTKISLSLHAAKIEPTQTRITHENDRGRFACGTQRRLPEFSCRPHGLVRTEAGGTHGTDW